MRLKDKVVLVSGAAGGIGYATCELFASEGAVVFASDIEMPRGTYPQGVTVLKLDVTSEESWQSAVDGIIELHGRLDVLVNNAGIFCSEPLDALDLDGWMNQIAVDQTGVFLGMREAVKVMRRQRSGSIINICTLSRSTATPGAHSYHAAKGAVRHMTRNAASTYVGDGIRVNAIHPGFIQSSAAAALAIGREASAVAVPPVRRVGMPMEVAFGCLFLASDEASFITGAELAIDGGCLAQ